MTSQEAVAALLSRGYVYRPELATYLHPKKTKVTHPKTYCVAANYLEPEALASKGGHSYLIELIDFEDSFRGSKP